MRGKGYGGGQDERIGRLARRKDGQAAFLSRTLDRVGAAGNRVFPLVGALLSLPGYAISLVAATAVFLGMVMVSTPPRSSARSAS